LYNTRTALEDSLKDKVSDEEKEGLEAAITAALVWMDDNPEADKDACDEKRKEVEDLANPIFKRAYESASGGGFGGGEGDSDAPEVEEVD
jgi:molecular chaperone DnaK (HSP70)